MIEVDRNGVARIQFKVPRYRDLVMLEIALFNLLDLCLSSIAYSLSAVS
jgi:hypothetical protein